VKGGSGSHHGGYTSGWGSDSLATQKKGLCLVVMKFLL
jgi:hypothetical protein